MFARLTVYDDIDLELNERAREWLQALGADPFRELPDALRPMLDMRPASVAIFEVVHRD